MTILSDGGAIGIMIGIVVVASLALQTALGPVMSNMVEAIKRAGLVRSERAGIVSLVLGTVLGTALGIMACVYDKAHDPIWIGIGAFAGLVGLGAGGVRSDFVNKGLESSRATSTGAITTGATETIRDQAMDGPSLLYTAQRRA